MRLSKDSNNDLGLRTRKYAVRIVKLYASLPKSTESQIFGRQLLRSGTSVGAHVAESNRGKSRADFVNKIEGALQELDESVYWMHILIDTGLVKESKLSELMDESEQIISILVTMANRIRRNDAK